MTLLIDMCAFLVIRTYSDSVPGSRSRYTLYINAVHVTTFTGRISKNSLATAHAHTDILTQML